MRKDAFCIQIKEAKSVRLDFKKVKSWHRNETTLPLELRRFKPKTNFESGQKKTLVSDCTVKKHQKWQKIGKK